MSKLPSILLVDDNPADNLIHRKVLERSGVLSDDGLVFQAENGREALDFMTDWENGKQNWGDRFPPPLILLDVNMPVMDGWQFLEAYREVVSDERWNSVIVVMLTTSINPEDRERALQSGLVRDFVNKPLSRESVRELVDRILPE